MTAAVYTFIQTYGLLRLPESTAIQMPPPTASSPKMIHNVLPPNLLWWPALAGAPALIWPETDNLLAGEAVGAAIAEPLKSAMAVAMAIVFFKSVIKQIPLP